MLNDDHNTHEDMPYLLGRRGHSASDSVVDTNVEVDVKISQKPYFRRDSLQPIGWGALTFGAGAMLGWLASTRKSR